MKKLKLTALASVLTLTAGLVHAQDNGALLDLLVKKKVISDQEAENVRAELSKEYASTSAGKLNVSSWVQEMKISGDIRTRFQYDNTDLQTPPTVAAPITGTLPQWQGVKFPVFVPNSTGTWYRDNNGNFHQAKSTAAVPTGATKYNRVSNIATKGNTGSQQDRWRFRLRIRDEFKLTNNWFGGVELSTAQAADSGNQTYGTNNGGFSKYNIFISKAYIGWNATDWATVTVGKQANPFYTTDMVWDPDINPDGAVEVINFHKMYFGGKSEGGYSKDGKSVASVPSIQEDRPWELSLIMGQFIFSDNIENGLVLSEPGSNYNDTANDAYLFDFQLQGSYKFQNNVKLTIAPSFMFYNSATVANADNSVSFATNTTGNPVTYLNRNTEYLGHTRDLQILTLPGDVTFAIGGLPIKVYWDFAYNIQGENRANDIYGLYYYTGAGNVTSYYKTQDSIAWLAGVQLGQNKKAGDWSIVGNFRQTGIAAVDPNLNDSDFALSKLNMQGFKVGAVYNFTDFCTAAVTYMNAWNLRNIVGGQATGGANLANANNVQVLQVDLQVKF